MPAGARLKVVNWAVAIAFLTASFDRVLVLQAGGSLRFAQILFVFVILAAIGQIIQQKTILWPRAASSISLFCVLQLLLITRSTEVFFSVELFILLLLSVFGVLALVQLYGRSEHLSFVMHAYLVSYVAMAAFGMFQFFAPSLHLGQPLVTQWVRHGLIPRISGFTYEPSYFATYLVMGWIAVVDLRLSKARIVAHRRWLWYAWLLSAALFCSTSKTGWLAMALEGIARAVPYVFRFVRGQASRFRVGSLVVPLPRLRAVAAIGLGLVLIAAFVTGVGRLVDLNIFLSGTGLNGSAAHSYNDRAIRANDTLTAFKQHPLVGVSFGGVPPEIAHIEGSRIYTREDVKFYLGFPVFFDVLAASGILGVLPFVWFFVVITVGETQLVRENWHDERAKWLHALIRALAFEGFVLLSDQYLFRIYLWFHIAMVVVVGYHLRYATARQALAVEQLVAA